MDVYETARWSHLVLSAIAFLWLVIRSVIRWHEYPYTIQLFLLTLSFYVFATMYGTAEAIYDDLPSGPRIWVYVIAVVALLITMALTQKKRTVVFHMGDMGGGPLGR